MELGLVIVTGELKATGTTRWTLVRDLALRAEAMAPVVARYRDR